MPDGSNCTPGVLKEQRPFLHPRQHVSKEYSNTLSCRVRTEKSTFQEKKNIYIYIFVPGTKQQFVSVNRIDISNICVLPRRMFANSIEFKCAMLQLIKYNISTKCSC